MIIEVKPTFIKMIILDSDIIMKQLNIISFKKDEQELSNILRQVHCIHNAKDIIFIKHLLKSLSKDYDNNYLNTIEASEMSSINVIHLINLWK